MKKFNKESIGKTSIRAFCLAVLLTMVSYTNVLATFAAPPTTYTIDVDVTVIGGSIGFVFGATGTGNLYMWQMNAQKTDQFRFRPHIKKGGWASEDVDLSGTITEATKNLPHHMKIEVNGDTIKTSIDGDLVHTVIDSTKLKGKFGRVGIRAFPEVTSADYEQGSIDNLVIKDGNGNTIYTNNFESSADDFPNSEIIGGQLQNLAGQEFSLQNNVWKANYTIDIDIAAINKAAGFVFSAIDNDNFYMWQLNNEKYPVRFRPHLRSGGGWNLIKEVDLPDIAQEDSASEQHMKIEVKGTTILTYINNIQVDSLVAEEFGYGLFGFREDADHAMEDGEFDNLVVKDGDGNVLYKNDFNQEPPFNFSQCTSIEGKLHVQMATNEFQLYSEDTEPIMIVPATDLSVGASANSIATFEIQSNIANWTVTTKATWLKISPATGSNSQTITVTADANATGLQRKDTLVISGAGITKKIAFVQTDRLDEIKSINNLLTMYPNPTNGIINIKTSDYKNVSNVQIFNLVGVVVKTTKLQQETSSIDLSDLSSGLYIVRIASGNNIKTQKITKK